MIATAEANRTILMEIGEAVKNIQLEQVRQAKKILAKQPDVSYNKDEQLRRNEKVRIILEEYVAGTHGRYCHLCGFAGICE